MRMWLWSIVTGTVALGVGKYLLEKFGDVFLQWLKDILDGYRGRTTVLANVGSIGGEPSRHRHDYVPREDTATSEATGVRFKDAVDRCETWAKGSSQFLTLSGPDGSGKTRTCIELAARLPKLREIKLPAYKASVASLVAALEKTIKKGAICLFEDYEDYRDAFGPIADLVVRLEARLIVVTRDDTSARREIGKRSLPQVITLGKASSKVIDAIVRSKARADNASVDQLVISNISSIAEGVPGLALLCLAQYREKGTLSSIHARDDVFSSVMQELALRVGQNWNTIRRVLGKIALARGLPLDRLREYYGDLQALLVTGPLVEEGGNLRLQPELLNTYVARQIYFTPTLSPDFSGDIEELMDTSAVQILTTLVYDNQKEAAALLLARAPRLGPRKLVELGLIAYENFRDTKLVEPTLTKLWATAHGPQEPDYYDKSATLLYAFGKLEEAEQQLGAVQASLWSTRTGATGQPPIGPTNAAERRLL